MSATGLPANQAGFGPLLPDVIQVPYDDVGGARQPAGDGVGDRVAAALAEPVVGPAASTLRRPITSPASGDAATLGRVLLVLDEVVCGFGRLGDWWGANYTASAPIW